MKVNNLFSLVTKKIKYNIRYIKIKIFIKYKNKDFIKIVLTIIL